MKNVFGPYNDSHWGPMLFCTRLTFIIWTVKTFFNISSVVFCKRKSNDICVSNDNLNEPHFNMFREKVAFMIFDIKDW